MDKKNKVTSFEPIAWTDPKDPHPSKTIKWFKNLEFDKFVYPAQLMKDNKPPSVMFVPETELM